jgi:hypothetical protein
LFVFHQAELESLAVAKREEKRLKKLEADTKAAEKASPAEAVYEVGPDGFDLSKPAEEPSNRDEELTENTPEARIEVSSKPTYTYTYMYKSIKSCRHNLYMFPFRFTVS